MPRFRVTKHVTALYEEVYEVDASNADEAERAVTGGRARPSVRSFSTTPGSAQPAGHPLQVSSEHAPSSVDFSYPKGQSGFDSAFCNAQFLSRPGDDHQHVVQEIVD